MSESLVGEAEFPFGKPDDDGPYMKIKREFEAKMDEKAESEWIRESKALRKKMQRELESESPYYRFQYKAEEVRLITNYVEHLERTGGDFQDHIGRLETDLRASQAKVSEFSEIIGKERNRNEEMSRVFRIARRTLMDKILALDPNAVDREQNQLRRSMGLPVHHEVGLFTDAEMESRKLLENLDEETKSKEMAALQSYVKKLENRVFELSGT